MKWLFIFLLFVFTPKLCYAEYTIVNTSALDVTHTWDHIGTSFAIQTVSYGFFRKVAKMSRPQAILFSLTATMIGTSLYSVSNNNPNLGRDIGLNAIGAGLSVGTCLVFDF